MRKRFIVGLAVVVGLYFLGSVRENVRQPLSSQPSAPNRISQREANPGAAPQPANKEPIAPTIVQPPTQRSITPSASAPMKQSFIRGKAVALRDGPGKSFEILDRYDGGREVDVLGMKGDWAQIRDRLTQREGWIFASLLSDARPEIPKQSAAPEPKAKPVPRGVPDIPDTAIIQRLIAASAANYPGSCPCPESYDQGGRRCGKRSAWSKGGGYAPLCYASDITPSMITAFRKRQ